MLIFLPIKRSLFIDIHNFIAYGAQVFGQIVLYKIRVTLMQTGIVKFFNHEKAYGFITPDNGGKDIFVHKNGVKAVNLQDGLKVQYNTEETPKGVSATEVEVI